MSDQGARRVTREDRRRQSVQPVNPMLQARRVRRYRLVVGESITMLPENGSTDQYLTIKDPLGVITLVPPDVIPYDLNPMIAGVWIYRWGEGEEHRLEVADRPSESPTVEVPIDVPPMTITRRPKF